MSSYITLAMPITDQECLLSALAELGFGGDKIEVHDEAQALAGYQGDYRQQMAHIIIRRQFIGPSSNDIGFERTSTGFRAHVSDFDRRVLGTEWLGRLNEVYKKHYGQKLARLAEEERRRIEEERRRLVEAQRQAIHVKAKKMGYRVEEKREGESLRLVLVKRVY